MSIGDITTLLQGSIWEVLTLAGPMLVSALVVGLLIAILQATTSIQEQTMTFVPKFVAILAVLALLGGWMFTSLGEFTISIFTKIPEMAR
ncbi:MAG: flagellar biosynthesis protein FliQ [Treponema sp.]|jgi:flagellar biosynthetic protein FliQ|nr:flagellar biosynthesis protein FliQ [Treponema sp.]